jgi:Icc-related predicted phosphoesterase
VKLLVFSDIHGDAAALRRLMEIEADAYFAAGDLCTWSRGLEEMGEILARRAGRIWVLPGNHESESQVETLCGSHGLYPLHGRSCQFGGYTVAGLGYSNPTPFNTPGEYSENELARRLEAFAGFDPLVMICHCPPKSTPLDQAGQGIHLGSTSVAAFIDKVQPRYFFCGHIHEAAGRSAVLGRTEAFNAGKNGVLLDLPDLAN